MVPSSQFFPHPHPRPHLHGNPQAWTKLLDAVLALVVRMLAGKSSNAGSVAHSCPHPRPHTACPSQAWTKFLDAVLAAVVRHVDWEVVKCLVIAGPGFAKDAFKEHLDAEAVRQSIRWVDWVVV